MGIKVKWFWGCPIHFLGVGHKFVLKLFQSPSEKKTMSGHKFPVPVREKQTYYSKELQLFLVLKSVRNLSWSGLLKRPQCEVTSRHP